MFFLRLVSIVNIRTDIYLFICKLYRFQRGSNDGNRLAKMDSFYKIKHLYGKLPASHFDYTFQKYREVPRKPMERALNAQQKKTMLAVFLPDADSSTA